MFSLIQEMATVNKEANRETAKPEEKEKQAKEKRSDA